jgi:hypothetical protein
MSGGLALELQQMVVDEYYILITNKIDGHGSNNFFYTVNATRAFSTDNKDSLEFANEYLAMMELEIADDEAIDDIYINQAVYFGERLDSWQLPESHPYVDSYLLFFPNIYGTADGTSFQMFECDGVEDVAFQIESELEMREGITIEEVIIFRCVDVELVQQIPSEFDEAELRREFVGE